MNYTIPRIKCGPNIRTAKVGKRFHSQIANWNFGLF